MSSKTDAITECTVDALIYFFGQNLAPSRKMIVNRIKDQKQGLNADGRLDLVVARRLNHLVEVGTLRRIEGNLYVPTEKYSDP